jgi:hypothetical protein
VLLSALDLSEALSVALSVALFVVLFVSSGPPFNPEGTMTGKLPAVDGDFSVDAFREVEFEDAALFGEAEPETPATRPDD